MARLFVLSGNFIGSTFDFLETSTVGRGDGADIVIAEASISRKHARLVPREEAGKWKVLDLDSSNGVFVGGKRVKSGVVGDGDTFRLGEVELRLRDDGAPDEPEEGFVEVAAEDAFPGDVFPGDVFPEDASEEEAPAVDDDGGFELEFGDDLDEAIASQPKGSGDGATHRPPARTLPPTSPVDSAPKPEPGSRAGARATAQRAQRRQEALKDGSVAARAAVGAAAGSTSATGGRAVLQYSAANHSSSGQDLSQLSAGKRALIILLGVALMGGIAYGAFTLTRTARNQSDVIDQ